MRWESPYDDVRPYAVALLKTAPEGVVWASAWPHVMCGIDMLDDGVMVNEVQSWTATHEFLRQRVFVDNPTVLYDFRTEAS